MDSKAKSLLSAVGCILLTFLIHWLFLTVPIMKDITAHIKTGQKNDIRIESDTNGRLTANFYSKCFVGW